MSWPSTWADDIEAGRVDLTDAEVRAALVADLRGWRAVGDAMHRVAADVRAVGDLPMVTINAVLSRLAGRPEIAEYVALVAAEINRLTAKVERLWDLLDEAHDSLPWCECCDVMGRPCSIGAALGESTPAPIDDRTERWIEKVKADAKPGPKHALSESTP